MRKEQYGKIQYLFKKDKEMDWLHRKKQQLPDRSIKGNLIREWLEENIRKTDS